jgi:hypothetical protein
VSKCWIVYLVHLHLNPFLLTHIIKVERKCIGGVMVSVLASSAVDCGFDRWSGQTKDYKIGICCFSVKHAALGRKSKDWTARNQDNVSEWSDRSTRRTNSTCWSRTKWTSSSSHWNLTCSHRQGIAEKLLNWRLSNNYSLTHSKLKGIKFCLYISQIQ